MRVLVNFPSKKCMNMEDLALKIQKKKKLMFKKELSRFFQLYSWSGEGNTIFFRPNIQM